MDSTAHGGFRTTRWSLVRSAGTRDEASRASLEELCRDYWYPLYALARRRGCAREEAEDAIQSLFARLIEREDFASADPDRGRFRSFLSAALRHHLANEWHKETAWKRGGAHARVDVDWARADERFAAALATDASPEAAFERDWALAVLDDALRRLRADYVERDGAALFDALAHELGGAADARDPDTPALSRAEQAAALGMSEGAWKTAISRARTRFRDRLRDAVADTLTDPHDVDAELGRLFDALG